MEVLIRKMTLSRSQVASTNQAPGMPPMGPLGQGRPLGRDFKARVATSRDQKLWARLQRLQPDHRDLYE